MSDSLNPSSESPVATVHSFLAGTKSFCWKNNFLPHLFTINSGSNFVSLKLLL